MDNTTPTESPVTPAEQAAPADQSVSLKASHIANICAAAMAICFFLPWIDFLGAKPSGFEMAKDGGKYLILWIIPAFGVFTLLASATKSNVKITGQIAGAAPFG